MRRALSFLDGVCAIFFNGSPDRLHLEHMPWTAAERSVVDFAMPVIGVITDIMRSHHNELTFLRALKKRFA